MILIISNNPLSLTNSNGRTMANMFSLFKKEEILNIYINGNPDYTLANFINITDKDAFFGVVKQQLKAEDGGCKNYKKRKKKKTAFKVLVREQIWSKKKLKRKLVEFLKQYNITDVFVQLGDYYFIINLATYIAKNLNCRVITFNTEDYYFKTWDFYKKKGRGIFWRTHQRKLKIAYEDIYSISEKNIFLTEDLEFIHKNKFRFNSSLVIYTSSSLKCDEFANTDNSKIITYCGNLENGREAVLYEIIKSVYRLDKSYQVQIYSPEISNSFMKKITEFENVFYEGFVDYDMVTKIISNSFLNIAIDGFDAYSIKDTIHAFSTKIADSLAVGNRFLLVSPKESSSYKYLNKYNASFLCGDLSGIDEIISSIISGSKTSYSYKRNALNLFNKNHNSVSNSLKFKEYISNHELLPIDFLVTTINKNSDEIINLAKEMNISGKAIIRSQFFLQHQFVPFEQKYSELKLISANDVGTSINRNNAFQMSNADYVLFADDDICFVDNYERVLTNVIRNNKYPKAIEFSFFDESGQLVLRKNKKTKCMSNLKYGVWFLLLSRKEILERFGYKPFNEKFGPGSTFSCGEDSIFRMYFYKKNKSIVGSNYVLGKNLHKGSTWFVGKTEKYFLDRSATYGYIYPNLYFLFIVRMKIQNLFNSNCKILKCISSAKKGKKILKSDLNSKHLVQSRNAK